MKITCRSCRTVLPASQLNVSTDVAVCHHCDETFSISEAITRTPDDKNFDLRDAPSGAWFYDDGTGWQLGASTRHISAWFLVPFMIVWSGFSLGGIYGSQIVQGKFDLTLSLFGIPFLFGTLLFGSIAIMSLMGKVTISVYRDEGRVFTGVGPFGLTKTFDWSAVTGVEETRIDPHSNQNRHRQGIWLVGDTDIAIFSMFSGKRRRYILQALRRLIADKR